MFAKPVCLTSNSGLGFRLTTELMGQGRLHSAISLFTFTFKFIYLQERIQDKTAQLMQQQRNGNLTYSGQSLHTSQASHTWYFHDPEEHNWVRKYHLSSVKPSPGSLQLFYLVATLQQHVTVTRKAIMTEIQFLDQVYIVTSARFSLILELVHVCKV